MQINIIFNPQRAHERWHLLQKEIEEQELDAMIWKATIVTPAKTGCCRSHKRIVQFAKDNNMESVTTMEDDCHFTGIGAWQYYLSQMPNDFDLFLGGIYDGKIESDNSVKVFTSTTLITVHQRFYDKFLSAKETVNLDFWLSRLGKGKYVVCNPLVVRQHDVPSDNNKSIDHEQHLRKYKFFGQ